MGSQTKTSQYVVFDILTTRESAWKGNHRFIGEMWIHFLFLDVIKCLTKNQ